MDVQLMEQLIEMDAAVKQSKCEFESWLWNVYPGIIVLFISFLIPLL